MKSEDSARIAPAFVLSVVGAIAVTKAGLGPRDGVLRWLVSSLVTGIVINTQEGKPLPFWLSASALAALGLVSAGELGPASRKQR